MLPLTPMDEQQQIDRLRALWKSGRDKYQSFFVTLKEVRDEVGDPELDRWCYSKLLIGLDVITKVSGILKKVDEATARAELATARAIAKEHRRLEREKREAEKFARDQEKIARRKTLAEQEIDAIKQENKARKKAEKQRQREQRLILVTGDLKTMIEQFQAAEKMCAAGTEQWIDGTIHKAKILCAMRDALSSDQDFGEWLKSNGISLSKDDRAALIGLGRLEEPQLREILSNTESRSVEQIWRHHRPLKAVVSGHPET